MEEKKEEKIEILGVDANSSSNVDENHIDFNEILKDTKQVLDKVVKTEDTTQQFTQEDIQTNRLKALLCYVFPPLPYLDKNSSPFVKYHACQGMNLLIAVVGYLLLRLTVTSLIKKEQVCGVAFESEFMCHVTPNWVVIPFNLIGLVFVALAIIGVCNVLLGKALALPIVSKLNLFKMK